MYATEIKKLKSWAISRFTTQKYCSTEHIAFSSNVVLDGPGRLNDEACIVYRAKCWMKMSDLQVSKILSNTLHDEQGLIAKIDPMLDDNI